jgi:hypothetical protein
MAKFRYVGTDERVFPTCGLVVQRGDVVDVCPDPLFFEPVVTKPAVPAEEIK